MSLRFKVVLPVAAAAIFNFSHQALGKGEPETLASITRSALQFIEASQVKAADGVYVPGEWRAKVYSSPIALMVGVGNLFGGDEEPSAFTTSTIVNQLASIHQMRPEMTSIPRMIARAMPSVERYREGDLYNFYPPRIWRGVRVHQAATMTLSPIWKGFTNIPEDADTSSVTYTARYYNQRLNQRATLNVPTSVLGSFARNRDLNRQPHYYNRNLGQYNTGAYLTWQFDENDPNMPRFYFAEPEQGKRIPFNRNDVDCIVNLNVLRLLALTGNSRLKGRKASCQLMSEIIRKQQFPTCGIYYPNTYYFGYSAALADQAGETCIRPAADPMVEYTLKNQVIDGGWNNNDNLHVHDRIHATSFAIYTLAQFGDLKDERVRRALTKAFYFLLEQKQVDAHGRIFWKGEVFFTATAIARSLVDWRSDAFTTALATSALLKANEALTRR